MEKGIFAAVGLGPGDPELVTLKALHVLQGVDRIYAVASRQSERSVSAGIVAALPGISAPLAELRFTMSTEWGERWACIEEHAATIHRELAAGRSCAFVTIGDPMTYSTASYLLRALLKLDGEVETVVVPGVNSWSLLAARSRTPLVEDREVLRIVPSYSAEGGEAAEAEEGTTVFLKTFHSRNRLLAKLPREAEVLYGENLGMPEEHVARVPAEIAARPEAYLSMLAIKKKEETPCASFLTENLFKLQHRLPIFLIDEAIDRMSQQLSTDPNGQMP